MFPANEKPAIYRWYFPQAIYNEPGWWNIFFHIQAMVTPTDELIFFRGVGIHQPETFYRWFSCFFPFYIPSFSIGISSHVWWRRHPPDLGNHPMANGWTCPVINEGLLLYIYIYLLYYYILYTIYIYMYYHYLLLVAVVLLLVRPGAVCCPEGSNGV